MVTRSGESSPEVISSIWALNWSRIPVKPLTKVPSWAANPATCRSMVSPKFSATSLMAVLAWSTLASIFSALAVEEPRATTLAPRFSNASRNPSGSLPASTAAVSSATTVTSLTVCSTMWTSLASMLIDMGAPSSGARGSDREERGAAASGAARIGNPDRLRPFQTGVTTVLMRQSTELIRSLDARDDYLPA